MQLMFQGNLMRVLQTVFGLGLLLISVINFVLSGWIFIPAPNLSLYPLSVGTTELSPWLMGISAIAGLLALGLRSTWLQWSVLILCSISLVISASPLIQLPGTIQRVNVLAEAVLEAKYLRQTPSSLQEQWRSQPFVLADVFKGIVLKPVRITTGIPFASPDNVPLTLNVYRPAQIGIYPGVVIVHGGAWRSGSPQDHEQFSRYLAGQGYTVVAVSYRLAPTYRFPAQLEDVQTAIEFIRQHAQEYEIDVDRMAIMGRSAGAHLAMLAAYQPNAPTFRAVVNYYGPVNLEKGYYDLPKPDPINIRFILEEFIGGSPATVAPQYEQASPWTFVRQGLPPSLLIYGDRDHVVKSKFGKQLGERLRSFTNTALLINIPWAEHAFDAVFNGVSNQFALYYTERFLAWALHP